MVEASLQNSPRRRGSGRGGRKTDGALVSSNSPETEGRLATTGQHQDQTAVSWGQDPSGVKPGPTADNGVLSEPKNHAGAPHRVAETTGDRVGMGRSPRSSQRTGKPSTRRRGTVCTVGRQEEDDKSVTVNTRAILDMQRKLYRWSYEEPNKIFTDLFNLVCDRRTLALAWQRLSRNVGSRTPGTDGVTRSKVEQRPGGSSSTWRISDRNCATERNASNLSGKGSSPSRASQASSARWAFPR